MARRVSAGSLHVGRRGVSRRREQRGRRPATSTASTPASSSGAAGSWEPASVAARSTSPTWSTSRAAAASRLARPIPSTSAALIASSVNNAAWTIDQQGPTKTDPELGDITSNELTSVDAAPGGTVAWAVGNDYSVRATHPRSRGSSTRPTIPARAGLRSTARRRSPRASTASQQSTRRPRSSARRTGSCSEPWTVAPRG